MTEEELLAEEYICNGKCQDDITRNYVHCKTCTKLKDFLAGYKARKAELEKENAELKEELTKKADTNHSLVEQMADLESENAELKKELIEKGQHLDLTEREWAKDMSKMIHFKTQLTKAKEIIKYLLSFIQKENYKTRWDINITEAEQFLSEVEK